jgi:peptidoglycan/LPS O-acetylase OafA/YrhL
MNGEGRKAAIPHISALDGARGLAVAGVLLFHGGHLLGGYLGVDFFFTLSGFLITSLLLAESTRTGSVGLGGFWARRARRLLPALAVLMIGVALYCLAFADPTQLAQIRGDAFATLAYAANWRAVFTHVNYWAIFSSPSPLEHTWSLAIEEQFYVIWPLVFVGLLAWWKRAAPKAVLVTSLALATVSSVLMVALYNPLNSSRVYYGTDTRAAAILFGAALAAWLTIYGPARTRPARVAIEVLGLAGAVAVAIAWSRLDGHSPTLYKGGFLLCGLGATAIIAAAVHPEPGPLARVLSFRPLCELGLISYGVYLYHWPIDVVLEQKRVGFGGWPLFALQTTLTLGAAIVSYRVIEQPIRQGARSSVQWRRVTPAVAIGLVLALFVSTLGARPHAGATPVAALMALAKKPEPRGSQRIMVVGNSVAERLKDGFAALHTVPALALLDAGVVGCQFPPAITIREPWPPCHEAWESAIVARFRPDIVFWVVTDATNQTLLYHGRPVKVCEEPYDSIYAQSLRMEIASLRAHGAKVVVTTEAYKRSVGGHDDAKVDCNNRLRRKVATETAAQLVDLFGYVCPRGQCREKQNGVTLRPDGVHYDGPGAKIVAAWLLDQARAPG